MTDSPKRMSLRPDFFNQEVHQLARSLLGCDLIRLGHPDRAGRICEVEVYGGSEDAASHANSGCPTPRTSPMFGTFGSAYVYRIYGIYHCLNVVAPAGSRAAAILIRAMEPLYGLDAMANSRSKASASRRPLTDIHSLLSGPGKICQAMEIGLEQNTLMLTEGELFVSEGQGLANHEIAATPRIGLNRRTCGDATDLPWRYVHRGSPFLSRPT